MKVALITGTNSGFGMLTAIELAKKEFKVIATMRDINKKEEIINLAKKENVLNLIDIQCLDVTDKNQICLLKNYIQTTYQSLDILVNNAGYCLGGIVEEIPIEKWKQQFETNFFGTVQMTKEMLPLLKKRKNSHIINVGSVSGIIGFPGMSPYSASKFAIEGFSESLRLELLQEKIHVSIIEPASYRTKIWEGGLKSIELEKVSAYQSLKETLYEQAKQSFEDGSDPKEVARLITKITLSQNPNFRYPIGKGALSLSIAKRILPWRVIEKIVDLKIKKKNKEGIK